MRLDLMVNVVDGFAGPEFDRVQVAVPGGAVVTWVNRTPSRQVVLPDNAETRGVITLSPQGVPGDVVQAPLHPLRQPVVRGRLYVWRLQASPSARIAITCL